MVVMEEAKAGCGGSGDGGGGIVTMEVATMGCGGSGSGMVALEVTTTMW